MAVATVTLRGRLPDGMRAREVAHWASTDCERARALGAAGSSGRAAATLVHGRPVDAEDASVFASEAGGSHEGRLLKDKAGALVALYRDRGVLEESPQVEILAPSRSDDEERLLERRSVATVLDRVANSGPPVVLVQARIPFTTGDVRHSLKPDVLVWDGRIWRVAEMKSFPDRDGYTDPTALAWAVRQVAAGVVGLRQALGAIGQDAARLVPAQADVILRRYGPEGARLHTLPALAEVLAVEEAVCGASAAATRALSLTEGRPLDTDEALRAVPHVYRASCHGSCGLADSCREEAAHRAATSLGVATEALTAVGITPERAVALASGPTALGDGEEHLAGALRAGWDLGRPVGG